MLLQIFDYSLNEMGFVAFLGRRGFPFSAVSVLFFNFHNGRAIGAFDNAMRWGGRGSERKTTSEMK